LWWLHWIFCRRFFIIMNLSSLNYSLFINMKWGILDIVAGYDVLYSHPCKSSFFASWTSVTAVISTTFFRRKVVLFVSGVLNLCLCSLPFSSIGFQMVFCVIGSSTHILECDTLFLKTSAFTYSTFSHLFLIKRDWCIRLI